MSGWTEQDLKLSGKWPVESDKLTMFVIVGISTEHFLRIVVGKGSRSQVELLELLEEEINLKISSIVAGVNSHRVGGVTCGKQ